MNNTIVWHCLPNESDEKRNARLNKELHRIFFEGKDVCPTEDSFVDDGAVCRICGVNLVRCTLLYHGTPRFLESLDAMQLIVESGKFAEVREEYFDWRAPEVKPSMPQYECTIFLYRTGKGPQDNLYFKGAGDSRQEAFYITALLSQGCMVVTEGQGEKP